ncbi:2-keto-3-deoxygluconate kinase [Limimaricola soesokkakensis]|uniref:2-dehydro-3-deoxygluconokinase n=1 Tax=Limimaricola soesokkakensis TaxID=1343159 RepID=A0A1X6ZEA2_9RHOB|nr:sugar kinase [Limimaricola soesokkakensis]PSK86362.1 2-keto-3-deoxygluconate kinase [Limimaricola soesokkakensis]SLN47161.1 2-dehydro-3-deoxygluconokinase [Limimaricola soesokkakensis]
MQLLAIGECMIEMSGGQDGCWRMGFAGDTLNTLWYARAGLDPAEGPVGYFTALGTDGFSDRIVAFLDKAGIATGAIRRIPDRRPGLYMIEQRDGDRAFTYWRDTSAARALADDEAVLRTAMRDARMIYLSGITLAILPAEGRARLLDALRAAREGGARIAFDPNIRPALWSDEAGMRDAITAAAAISDIALPSFDDEARWFGDADPAACARRYAAAGAGEVAVKDGAGPVTLLSEGETTVMPVPPAVKVVDATGAGDSFNGGYLAARLNGASPVEAARAGTVMAARVIAAHGAIIDLPETRIWDRDAPKGGRDDR